MSWTRAMTASAVAGLVLSAGSTFASYAAATGTLPRFLFDKAPLASSLARPWGVPVEYALGALWALFLVLRSSRRDSPDSATSVGFIIGIVLGGGTLGLAVVRPRCVALWSLSACAFGTMIAAGLARGATFGTMAREVWVEVANGARDALMRTRLIASCLALGIGAQALAHGTRSASAAEASEQQLVRWFLGARRAEAVALRAKTGVRVVVFTDYQCPVCLVMVPQYRAVIEGFRAAGHPVELVVRDFPLEPECNPVAATPLHPVACEAAVAMRIVRQSRQEKAAAFEHWLASEGSHLSEGAVRSWLAGEGLAELFVEGYASALAEVRRDAELGRSLGVYATPTLFLDGVKLPSVTARGLEVLLAAELRRRGG